MRTSNALTYGLSLGLVPAAVASDGSKDERIEALESEVAQLRATVSDLRATQAADQDRWLTEERAAQVRGIVQDVLADAETRASLLSQGMTAGWSDGHFMLGSADGNYLLEVSGQMDVRWVFNAQDDAPDGDDNQYGFELRRIKLAFEGHVLDPSWEYLIQGAFDREGGAFELEDATITKTFENGVAVTFGQFKLPFLREENMSSKRQLAVERSLVNEEFNQDRTKGIQVAYEADTWRALGAYGDGFNSDNTAFADNDVRYAFTGRGEYMFAGDWKQFRDFTSPQDSETAFMVGVAGHFQNGNGVGGLASQDRFTWTVDASLEMSGISVYGALIGNHLSDMGAVPDADQWGFVVQGGYYVAPEWEVFGRYEYGDLDAAGEEDLNIITAGVNYYINSHNLKWTTDIGFGLDPVSGGWSSTEGAGWRTDSADGDGQVVLRTQFQLLF